MLLGKFLRTQNSKVAASVFMIINAFVWLFCISATLKKIIYINAFSNHLSMLVWGLNFCGATFSILFGAFYESKLQKRTTFLFFWTMIGVISSLSLPLINVNTPSGAIAISFLFSASLGLGLAACTAFFADCTRTENRGKLAGITMFLLMGLGVLMMSLVTEDILSTTLILALWRALGLIPFLFIHLHEDQTQKKKDIPFTSIIKERSFILYAIPWTMLLLVNYLFMPIGTEVYGENFLFVSVIIENVLAGVFAIIGGFLCDIVGRKRVSITGFVILGLGYAFLGMYPLNILSWYFYMVADGIAWGMLCVIFLFTIWGDLSSDRSSEKYYALASLPYLLSNFLRFSAGSFIASTISVYAVFSFAAFFLFLAVIPLMFAPETLPEKKLRERELKKYIEKAKKIKEKYV
jgi:MFS family permease